MDAKEIASRFPELGTEEEIATIQQRLDSISKLNLYLKRITCGSSGFGRKERDQGHILICSLSADNVVGPPIGMLDLDAEGCDALLRALFNMRKQFRAMAEYRKNNKQ